MVYGKGNKQAKGQEGERDKDDKFSHRHKIESKYREISYQEKSDQKRRMQGGGGKKKGRKGRGKLCSTSNCGGTMKSVGPAIIRT